VAQAGGRVLVQAPDEAAFSSMPAAALAAAPGGRPVRGLRLAQDVQDEVAGILSSGVPPIRTHGWEAHMAMAETDDPGYLAEGESRLTRLACPECGGGLAQVDLPQISYFRCHIGHQYAPQTLAAAQADAAEAKLWSAVAALEEQAALLHYLDKVEHAEQPEQAADADRITERAAVLREQVRQWTAPPVGQSEEPTG
jgi:two-component system chemotaxis response regulator CheB